MASQMIDVYGKLKYVHVVNFDKFGSWSLVLYPDSKSLEKIRDLQAEGIKNIIKKDDDNQYFVKFRRDPTKPYKGKVIAFSAPKVVGPDNEPMDGTKIGWGSDAIVRLDVYEHGTPAGGKAKAARLDSLKITNLVPFEPDRSDWTDKEKNSVSALVSQSPPPTEFW